MKPLSIVTFIFSLIALILAAAGLDCGADRYLELKGDIAKLQVATTSTVASPEYWVIHRFLTDDVYSLGKPQVGYYPDGSGIENNSIDYVDAFTKEPGHLDTYDRFEKLNYDPVRKQQEQSALELETSNQIHSNQNDQLWETLVKFEEDTAKFEQEKADWEAAHPFVTPTTTSTNSNILFTPGYSILTGQTGTLTMRHP